MKKRAFMILLVVMGISVTLMINTVAANGTPVNLYLAWLPGITNWTNGQRASGTALVSVSLGELKMELQSLPHLTTSKYEAWLVTEDMKQMESMGRFNSDMLGRVKYEHVREDLPAREYRFLLISVEPDPDPDPASSGKWAVGAIFPDTSLLVVTATPPPMTGAEKTPTGESSVSVTPTPPPPLVLPKTGGSRPFFGIGLLVLGMSLIGGGIVWQKRRKYT